MTTLTADSIVGVRRPRPQRRRLAPAPQPAATGFDRDYWLRHCEGYRVDGAEGRLGFVESIRDGAGGEPILAVRAGRFGRRLLLIRAGAAAFIVPRAERIWLTAPTEIAGSEERLH